MAAPISNSEQMQGCNNNGHRQQQQQLQPPSHLKTAECEHMEKRIGALMAARWPVAAAAANAAAAACAGSVLVVDKDHCLGEGGFAQVEVGGGHEKQVWQLWCVHGGVEDKLWVGPQ